MSKWNIVACVSLATAVITIGACGPALTQAGQTVEYQMAGEAPPTCRFVGDVANESTWDPPTSMQDAKTDLRNRAGSLGADYLVIDTIESRPGNTNPEQTFYVATGRAYACRGAQL